MQYVKSCGITSLSVFLHGILFLSIVFSWGCLLPCIGRTNSVSQIQFNGSEPRAVGSSWRSFPVWWRLVNRSSNCMVIVFIRSTVCDMAKESQASFHCHVGKQPWHWPDICISYMTSVEDPQDLAESPCIKCIYQGTQAPCCGPSFMPIHQDWNYVCLIQPYLGI